MVSGDVKKDRLTSTVFWKAWCWSGFSWQSKTLGEYTSPSSFHLGKLDI